MKSIIKQLPLLQGKLTDISRWAALLCAFGIPWSNACFNIGLYCMLITFTLSFTCKENWKVVLKSPAVIITLSLFSLITLETIFTASSADLAKYDLIHYRKLIAVLIFATLFTTNNQKKQLLISYCLGVVVLMLPTLLDGFGLGHIIPLELIFKRNAAYALARDGVPNLVYWRNQIIHGFHVSILFSACMLGAIYYKKYRGILIAASMLCVIDLLFFIYGRMALLSLLVAIIAMAIFYSPTKKHLALLLLFLTIFSSVAYISLPNIKTRMSSISNEANAYSNDENINTSGGIRLHYWQRSWHLFTNSPIIGNGSGSFRQSLISDKDVLTPLGHRHTHNEYLTQLAQYGLVGFCLLVSLIFISLKNSKKIKDKWLSHTLITGIIIFSLNALTDSSLHNDWEGWTFVLLVSMACINIKPIMNSPAKVASAS
jgi:O-antigen ligase